MSNITIKDDYQFTKPGKNEIIFTSEAVFSGNNASQFLADIKESSEAEFWRNIKNYYSDFFNIIEELYAELDLSRATKNELRFQVKYRIELKVFKRFLRKYRYDILPIMTVQEFYYTCPPEVTSDFLYGERVSIHHLIKVHDKYIPPSQKREVRIHNPVFNFEKQTYFAKGEATFDYHFERLKDLIPKEEYAEFYAQHQEAKKAVGNGVLCSTSWLTRKQGWIIWAIIVVIAIGGKFWGGS